MFFFLTCVYRFLIREIFQFFFFFSSEELIVSSFAVCQHIGDYLKKHAASCFLGNLQVSVFVCSVAQSCLTLCNPMDCSPPGSSVCGILQARILEWQLFPSPGHLPDPGTEPRSLVSPVLAGGFFTTSATWEAPSGYLGYGKSQLCSETGQTKVDPQTESLKRQNIEHVPPSFCFPTEGELSSYTSLCLLFFRSSGTTERC